jgi:hypothetical protein
MLLQWYRKQKVVIFSWFLTMLSLFAKSAPKALRSLATTASRPAFPTIQKSVMSTCKSAVGIMTV